MKTAEDISLQLITQHCKGCAYSDDEAWKLAELQNQITKWLKIYANQYIEKN